MEASVADSSSQVPTLDLSMFDSNPAQFVQDLGQAYQRFGFCGLRQHGVSDEITANAYRVFKAFFDLPTATKQQYQATQGGARGYTGVGIETAKDAQHPDLKEFWHVGRELPDGHRQSHRMPPNQWPSEIPEFKRHAYALFQSLDQLGRRVLQAMALFLGQNQEYFEDRVNEGNSILRPIHYPPISEITPSVRAGQHEDINLITLLIGSEQPGLEILNREGRWVPVTTVPGAIMCNIGDMMQRLTNHVFPSTTHRVVNPPAEQALESRYSIPFFLHPNADFMIETLDSCISEARPNRYPEALSSHEYLEQRLVEIGLKQ